MATIHQVAGNFSLPITSGGESGQKLVVGPNSGGYGTIQAAIDAAEQGDTIFVQPGTYTETLTVTTDYITIIGAQLGGYGRPDVTATTGIVLTVTAQGFVCKRMRFFSTDGSDTVWHKGNGFKYEDCVFDDASDADLLEVRVLVAWRAADDTNQRIEVVSRRLR